VHVTQDNDARDAEMVVGVEVMGVVVVVVVVVVGVVGVW
jgi:hypothetical protein